MTDNSVKPVTVKTFNKMKLSGEKITMLTAYDYSTAKYIDEAGIDSILVGDSVGMTVLGYDTTVNVTIDDMVVFTKAVARATKRAAVIADMPFLSCQVSLEQTVPNAGKLIQAGACAVKIEGASDFILKQINHLVQSGINVMGHLGFTPQYINTLGGYYVQGKSLDNTLELFEAAKKLQDNGVFAIVLEMVPEETAKYISENLSVPVIGIGAGKYCDGQVLVIDDILGKFSGNIPKFAKQYANLKELIKTAAAQYYKDVKNGSFPSDCHSFHLSQEEHEKLEHHINKQNQ